MIEGFADGHGDCPAATSGSSVQLDRQNNSLDFSLPDGPRRLLVINLPPYSSWTLTVGGEPVPLYNLSSRQIAALIPEQLSGPTRLAYRPVAFEWRLGISSLGWLLCVLALCAQLVTRRRMTRGRPA